MSQLVRSAKTLGAALRRHRNEVGLTQNELAQRAGIQQRTVSMVEKGVEGVRLSSIIAILRALDLELLVQARSKGSHADIEDMF